MSELETIYLRWSGVQVPRHLYTLVMLHLENLETRYPDVLPEFLQLACDPGHEPSAEARAVLARLMLDDRDQPTRDIVLDSEYVRGVEAPRAAQILSAKLGTEVTADGVAELWRRGLVPIVGEIRDVPLFDRVAIGRLADRDAAADATRAGRMRTPDEAATYLDVSRAAFDALTEAGYIHWCQRIWEFRPVPGADGWLYITCDLDRVAQDPGIDWPSVRSAPAGHPLVLPLARTSQAPPESPWFRVPCSPHCRCRLQYQYRQASTAPPASYDNPLPAARRRPADSPGDYQGGE